jgi:hypothetical protein
MKGIELLTFLDKKKAELLKLSAQNYKRFARIYFAITSATENEVIVKIWQEENVMGRYLNAKELIDRGKEVFKDILPDTMKVHFRPIPYKIDSLVNVTQEYVYVQMEKFNLRSKDLVKLLNIDKGTLSRTLSSNALTKSSKAMFYYVFKYLEVMESNKTEKVDA